MNDISLPAEISIATARLPKTYEQAKQALTACNNIDECKDWADKAAALASYAKQADDNSLHKFALRIQARAVRRCGELLKQYDGRGRPGENNKPALTISQRAIAGQAGMSLHQERTAVRVANVPADTFDDVIERGDKPTITKLADMGRQSRTPPPDGFSKATHLLGTVRRFAEFCGANDAEYVAGGVLPKEAAELRQQVSVIDGWLDRFIVNLKG